MSNRNDVTPPPSSDDENWTASEDEHELPSRFERTENPLTIHLVLEKLFEYVSGNELKSCRLVCKQWNNLTIPFCHSRLHVNISMIGDFVKLMETNTLGIPFSIFQFKEMILEKNIFQQFLHHCGDLITEFICEFGHTVENMGLLLKSAPNLEFLKLPDEFWTKHDRPCVVKLFPGPEQETPKLTSLKSLDCSDWEPYNADTCPTFFDELFGAAENISSLNLRNPGGKGVLRVLEAFEKCGQVLSILKLTLVGISKKHLDVLWKLANRQELAHLDFVFESTWDATDTLWFHLVTFFKDSLVSLRVYVDTSRGATTSTPITFPVMPKLKLLDYNCDKNTIPGGFDFKTTFPVLEKLHVSCRRGFNFDNFITGTEECPEVKSLISRIEQITMERLDRILTIFPSLVMFECRIGIKDGAEIVKKIWTEMIQLEGLNLYGTLSAFENIDSLVTGIPFEEISKLGDFNQSLQQMKITDRVEKIVELANKHRRHPSVGNLTNLRTLRLEFRTMDIDAEIGTKNDLTDLSAYFGLYSLKYLRHLYISECEVSEPCFEMLVDDMDLHTWSFISRKGSVKFSPKISPQKLKPKCKCVFPMDIEFDAAGCCLH